MFERVLIANRGEIAIRVAQTLREMGITAIAVHSEADRGALHVASADEAYSLGGTTSAESPFRPEAAGHSYLRGDRVIEIARERGAQAIHPGYGFLSENAKFARACAEAGIAFIGPSPEAIEAMGDKVVAKRLAVEAGVPIVPGFTADGEGGASELGAIEREAARLGYPILVKAAAGGGGKGMRVVRAADELSAALESARREAHAAFGDGRVFLEKYVTRARHVEIQIFGDHHGNVVHLFERECSIQRRHQKIIEEAPAPALPTGLREKLGDAAVRLAKKIGYASAGTVEFMVDDRGEFYFLEVNTRLQVEHPVTELTVHADLVRAQVEVAAGGRLPFEQGSLRQTGHALECRICAEEPERGFLPSTGSIERWDAPLGPGLRLDSGVRAGSQVSVHYDPMLAKLIAWGSTRAEAIARMDRALARFVILGVATNVAFLRRVIAHPDFAAARLHTRFLDEHDLAVVGESPPEEAFIAAALVESVGAKWGGRAATARGSVRTPQQEGGPWERGGAWRGVR